MATTKTETATKLTAAQCRVLRALAAQPAGEWVAVGSRELPRATCAALHERGFVAWKHADFWRSYTRDAVKLILPGRAALAQCAEVAQ